MDHEIEVIRKGFKHFDRDAVGKIKTMYVGDCLRWLKLVPTEAEIVEFMKIGDPEQKGRVDWKNFLAIVAHLWVSDVQKREGAAWAAFLCFDKQDKGKLPVDVMKSILMDYGEESIPEKEVNKILKPFIDKKENTIEYGYMIRAWSK